MLYKQVCDITFIHELVPVILTEDSSMVTVYSLQPT